MNKTIVGALLIVLITVIGAFGVKLILPLFEEFEQIETSDADKTKGKIRIALDNWVGYFILNSPEMADAMRRSGYILICEDDSANYAERMRRLKDGEIDFAVATVDSFILNAAGLNYPGAIVMVIDESKGGDAILAVKDRVSGLDGIKGRSDIRVAFTPDSPSHHLAKAAAEHFSVPELLPRAPLRIETDGSRKAMEKLLSGQTDVAICWEPDVSLALSHENIVKILGTEDTEGLIVDILVAGRKTIAKDPDLIRLLLSNYFRVLKKYRSDPRLLADHVKKQTGLSEDKVKPMLDGVHWVNFSENCEKWFGIAAPGQYADDGIATAISASAAILVSAGDFAENPVPDDDPYRLTNSDFLEELFAKGGRGLYHFGGHGLCGRNVQLAGSALFPLEPGPVESPQGNRHAENRPGRFPARDLGVGPHRKKSDRPGRGTTAALPEFPGGDQRPYRFPGRSRGKHAPVPGPRRFRRAILASGLQRGPEPNAGCRTRRKPASGKTPRRIPPGLDVPACPEWRSSWPGKIYSQANI